MKLEYEKKIRQATDYIVKRRPDNGDILGLTTGFELYSISNSGIFVEF